MSKRAGVDLLLVAATDSVQLAQTKALFSEYADGLGIDLSFQNFEAELDAFPSGYLSPDGALILAIREGAAIGCVGVRRLDVNVCEMKRLYVRADARDSGLGLSLCRAAMDAGKNLGFARMRLDTLPTMVAARKLYRHLGFKEIVPYYHNPVEGTSYMEREL